MLEAGPANLTAAIAATWSEALPTPCHELDPNCQLCASGNCSSSRPVVVSSTGVPSYFCNAAAVACRDDRVANVSLGVWGLVLKGLPPQLNQLDRLQTLGELAGTRVLVARRTHAHPLILRVCCSPPAQPTQTWRVRLLPITRCQQPGPT
jgi:hypothetical protein